MRFALTVIVLLLAGCATRPESMGADTIAGANATADANAAVVANTTPSPGLFVVSGGLQPTDEIPGLTVSEVDGRAMTIWSPREGLGEHTMHLLLLQATADTDFMLEEYHDVQFTGNPESLDWRETACAARLVGPGSTSDRDPISQPVPGEYLIALASGEAPDPPAELLDFGFGHGAVYGTYGPALPGAPYGSVSGRSPQDGNLTTGDWMIWGAGLSGVGWQDISGESEMRFTLTTDAPMRIVELPPTTLYCGMGFSYLQNATFHTGYPGYHVGGSLSMQGLYGAAFEWNDYCWPLDTTWPLNSATLDMDGKTTPLNTATKAMSQGTFGRGPAALTVDHWKGYPNWAYLGLPLAIAPFTAGAMPGCLD